MKPIEGQLSNWWVYVAVTATINQAHLFFSSLSLSCIRPSLIDFGVSANFRQSNGFGGFSFLQNDANFGKLSFGDFSFGRIALRRNLIAPSGQPDVEVQ